MVQSLKAAGCTAVAAQGFDRVVQRPLHLGLLFGVKACTCQPLAGSDQGWVILQMRCVMRTAISFAHVRLQCHQGVKYIQALQVLVTGLQQFQHR